MSWIYFALLTALCWGIGQFFIKKGSVNITPLWNVFFNALFALIIYVPYAVFHEASISVSLPHLLLIFIAASLYNVYYYAIEKGSLIITGTILAMYPLVTVMLSIFFLNEQLTPPILIGMTMVLCGIFFLLYKKEKKKNRIPFFVLVIAITGSIAMGVADFLGKVLITATSEGTYIFILPFTFLLSAFIFGIFDKKGRTISLNKSRKNIYYSIFGIGCMTVGLLTFNLALTNGLLSLVSLVSSAYICLSALLAYFFLKERISKMQSLGILSMFIGIVILTATH